MYFSSFAQTVALLYVPFLSLVVLGCIYKSDKSWNPTAATLFQLLFIFRYYRLVVGVIFYLRARPIPVPEKPSLTNDDVTVVIPTVNPNGLEFPACVASICANLPREIFIVTSDEEKATEAAQMLPNIDTRGVSIRVLSANIANKRQQVAMVIGNVTTCITVSVDDSVVWPSKFLPAAIAPFEDPNIALVGTTKRVRRTPKDDWVDDIFNFLGCLYLERHNFEILSTSRIDGGAFVISGRTALYRTSMIAAPIFLERFTNERFFFKCFGPLNADDDNFITRWAISHGWSIAIHSSPDTTIETTLGDKNRFLGQCLR
jgi:hypothetical protein